jgi:hypothetical protein
MNSCEVLDDQYSIEEMIDEQRNCISRKEAQLIFQIIVDVI